MYNRTPRPTVHTATIASATCAPSAKVRFGRIGSGFSTQTGTVQTPSALMFDASHVCTKTLMAYFALNGTRTWNLLRFALRLLIATIASQSTLYSPGGHGFWPSSRRTSNG